MERIRMSRRSLEAERASLLRVWGRTFDVGGEHHSRIVRDEGTVDHIASIVEEADRTGRLNLTVVARVVHLT
jgi:hypothetical protein